LNVSKSLKEELKSITPFNYIGVLPEEEENTKKSTKSNNNNKSKKRKRS
jgi:hypothetical protein